MPSRSIFTAPTDVGINPDSTMLQPSHTTRSGIPQLRSWWLKDLLQKGRSFWEWQQHFESIGLVWADVFNAVWWESEIFQCCWPLEIHSEGFLTHWKDVDSQNVQWNRTEYVPTSSTFLSHKTNKKHVWNGYPCRTDLWAETSIITTLFQLHFTCLNPRCDAELLHEP